MLAMTATSFYLSIEAASWALPQYCFWMVLITVANIYWIHHFIHAEKQHAAGSKLVLLSLIAVFIYTSFISSESPEFLSALIIIWLVYAATSLYILITADSISHIKLTAWLGQCGFLLLILMLNPILPTPPLYIFWLILGIIALHSLVMIIPNWLAHRQNQCTIPYQQYQRLSQAEKRLGLECKKIASTLKLLNGIQQEQHTKQRELLNLQHVFSGLVRMEAELSMAMHRSITKCIEFQHNLSTIFDEREVASILKVLQNNAEYIVSEHLWIEQINTLVKDTSTFENETQDYVIPLKEFVERVTLFYNRSTSLDIHVHCQKNLIIKSNPRGLASVLFMLFETFQKDSVVQQISLWFYRHNDTVFFECNHTDLTESMIMELMQKLRSLEKLGVFLLPFTRTKDARVNQTLSFQLKQPLSLYT